MQVTNLFRESDFNKGKYTYLRSICFGLHLSSSLKAYSLYNIIIYSDSRGAFIHEIRLKRFHYCIAGT